MGRLKGIVFDIDDTLFLERDYVLSGFREVARHVSGGSRALEQQALDYLWTRFAAGDRTNLFDRMVIEQHPFSSFDGAELVAVYRTHKPTISLSPQMRDFLILARAQGTKLGAISDGYLPSQWAKAAALGLNELMDKVILTDEYGREYWKPHRRAFEEMQALLGLRPDHLTYVADNCAKDFFSPKSLGWLTIRLVMPGQVHCDNKAESFDYEPQLAVEGETELLLLLTKLIQ